MITDILEIGDKLIVEIDKEAREWGYNPCPDGTVVEVTGFGEIDYSRVNGLGYEPGYYETRSSPKLRLPTGEIISVGSWNLKPTDVEDYERRVQAWRDAGGPSLRDKKFIRPLPKTEFWEGDRVYVTFRGKAPEERIVQRINYTWMKDKTVDGSTMAYYQVSESMSAGWHTYAAPEEMTLIERGNLWKWYHNKPLLFADLKEEAAFHQMTSRVEEVRNPKNDLYKWTKDEALDAIKASIADGMVIHQGLFGNSPSVGVQKFKDRDLGERVRKATLEGFEVG